MQIGEVVPVYEAMNRKTASRWRAAGKILDIDEAGVTVKFQSQTLKVARYRARKKLGEMDAREAEWNPSQAQPRIMEPDFWTTAHCGSR